MLKSFLIFITITAYALAIKAQSSTQSSSVKLKSPVNLAKFCIPPGNYSGITHIDNNIYAVVSDKATANGFYLFEININNKGKIKSVQNIGFRSDSVHNAPRDTEGIIFHHKRNTVFISAESDQQILEYTLQGKLTGNALAIPEQFCIDSIRSNYGFEALAYSPDTHLFWTTTESTLLSDQKQTPDNHFEDDQRLMLRLQSFTEDLQPSSQYIYYTDAPIKSNKKHKHYAFGVPAITALPDGTLLILERELYISKRYINSSVMTKIYRVNPAENSRKKNLITKFCTPINKLANYEGMCLGPTLQDGSQTLLLICDSQNRYGNSLYHLKDKIRVIILSK